MSWLWVWRSLETNLIQMACNLSLWVTGPLAQLAKPVTALESTNGKEVDKKESPQDTKRWYSSW